MRAGRNSIPEFVASTYARFRVQKSTKSARKRVLDAVNRVLFSKTVSNKFITRQHVVFIILLYCNYTLDNSHYQNEVFNPKKLVQRGHSTEKIGTQTRHTWLIFAAASCTHKRYYLHLCQTVPLYGPQSTARTPFRKKAEALGQASHTHTHTPTPTPTHTWTFLFQYITWPGLSLTADSRKTRRRSFNFAQVARARASGGHNYRARARTLRARFAREFSWPVHAEREREREKRKMRFLRCQRGCAREWAKRDGRDGSHVVALAPCIERRLMFP